ncbi:MAG TPA: thiamine pyrophosphate-binding protein [Xanthobacteraceae bacterium]|nr:thiamine pyrophosphate-binding protein [Xanthobacteraceae bacterium]
MAPEISPTPWAAAIFATLQRHAVSLVAYVPDAGHAELIRRAEADNAMRAVLLTSEEEGVGLLAGAWLGGRRGVLLMQSSGVGNCINMLSLVRTAPFPFLALVTMRGEFGEFNHWQVPMGTATPDVLRAMGLRILRADFPDEVTPVMEAAAQQCYAGGTATVVLLSQRLIGAKAFAK